MTSEGLEFKTKLLLGKNKSNLHGGPKESALEHITLHFLGRINWESRLCFFPAMSDSETVRLILALDWVSRPHSTPCLMCVHFSVYPVTIYAINYCLGGQQPREEICSRDCMRRVWIWFVFSLIDLLGQWCNLHSYSPSMPDGITDATSQLRQIF